MDVRIWMSWGMCVGWRGRMVIVVGEVEGLVEAVVGAIVGVESGGGIASEVIVFGVVFGSGGATNVVMFNCSSIAYTYMLRFEALFRLRCCATRKIKRIPVIRGFTNRFPDRTARYLCQNLRKGVPLLRAR